MYNWLTSPASWLQPVLRLSLVILVVTLAFLTKTIIARADGPDELDMSFNGTGIVTTPLTNPSPKLYSAVIQPDGKILVAGLTTTLSNQGDIILIRYTTDGQLDTTFNGTGIVTTSIGSNTSSAHALILDSNQKIVAAGISDSHFAVIRYHPDGSLDSTFNGTGIVTTSFGLDQNATAVAVRLQPDDAPVVSGFTSDGSGNRYFALAHYKPDGTLDPTINSTGLITTPWSYPNYIWEMAFQPDGKTLAVGYDFFGDSFIFVTRHTITGAFDPTFNGTGVVTTSFEGNLHRGYGIATQPDGRVIAVGATDDPHTPTGDLLGVRYLSSGTLDPNFNGTGIITTSVISADLAALSVAIQPDGNLVIGGFAGKNGNSSDAFVARYSSEGQLDTSFGTTGLVTISVAVDSNEYDPHILLQPDGKIVLAGSYVEPAVNQAGFFVVRYLGTASPPVVPALTVTKSANVTVAEAGQPITYTYRLTNSGDLTLTNLVAHDDHLGPVPLTTTILAPTATLAALLPYTPTAADLNQPLVNTLIVTGTAQGYPPLTATATLQLLVQDTLPPLFPANALITPTQGVSLSIRRPLFLWKAATDNSTMVSYTLFLTGPSLQAVQSFTISLPAYTPTTDLSPGAYTWTVRAHDLAGNSVTVAPPAQFAIKQNTSPGRKLYLPLLIKE